MTIDDGSALELRRRIGDVYLADDPPPGLHRASWLTTALAREPGNAEFHAMARDFLEVIELYRRLVAELDPSSEPGVGLVLHGLVGHATAELVGGTRSPGWRAAALDLLDPDGKTSAPLDHEDMVRLFALALGPNLEAVEPGDEGN